MVARQKVGWCLGVVVANWTVGGMVAVDFLTLGVEGEPLMYQFDCKGLLGERESVQRSSMA